MMRNEEAARAVITTPDGTDHQLYYSAAAHYVIEAETGESAASLIGAMAPERVNGGLIARGQYRPIIGMLLGGLEGARREQAQRARKAGRVATKREYTIDDAAEILQAVGPAAVLRVILPAVIASFPEVKPGDDEFIDVEAGEGAATETPLTGTNGGNAPETPPPNAE